MKKVLRRTIDPSTLKEMNKRLLSKVSSDSTQVAEYAEPARTVQRARVEPTELSVQWKHNKEKLGLVKEFRSDSVSSHTHDMTSAHHGISDKIFQRKATIFQQQSRSVQDTPKLDWGQQWIVQHEPIQQYKSPLMHWGKASEDPHAAFQVDCNSLEKAIEACNVLGFGYDIIMPKYRHHLRKAYIDNFKWKGEPEKKPVEE